MKLYLRLVQNSEANFSAFLVYFLKQSSTEFRGMCTENLIRAKVKNSLSIEDFVNASVHFEDGQTGSQESLWGILTLGIQLRINGRLRSSAAAAVLSV